MALTVSNLNKENQIHPDKILKKYLFNAVTPEPEGIYLPDLKKAVNEGKVFQDANGTTPVNSVEEPVGLILEGSQGAELGPEVVTNGGFDTDSDWATSGTIAGGVLTLEADGVGLGLFRQSISVDDFPVGKIGILSYDVLENTLVGVESFAIQSNAGIKHVDESIGTILSTVGSNSIYVKRVDNNDLRIIIYSGSISGRIVIDNVSLKVLKSNHLIQPTDSDRPILSARVNGLKNTEDFSTSSWDKGGGATVTGQNVLNFPVTNARITQNWYTDAPVGRTVKGSVVLSGTGSIVLFIIRAVGGGDNEYSYTVVDLTSTPTRYEVEHTIENEGQIGFYLKIEKTPASTATQVTATQADLRYVDQTTGLIPDYQRVGDVDIDPTDYDWQKFPWYLSFNGVNTWMKVEGMTPNSDEVFVAVGMRKASDDAAAISVELGTSSTANNTFSLYAPVINTQVREYSYRSKGDSVSYATLTDDTYGAPVTSVVSGLSKISEDTCKLRVDGQDMITANVDQGTGNYADDTLYIGSRAGTGLFFNGNIYSLVLSFKIPNDSVISKIEHIINQNTKVY